MKKRYILGSLLALSSCNMNILKKDIKVTGEIRCQSYQMEHALQLKIYDISLKNGFSQLPPKVNIYGGSEKKIEITCNESLFEEITCVEKNSVVTIKGNPRHCYLTKNLQIDIYGYAFTSYEFSFVNCKFSEDVAFDTQTNISISAASYAEIMHIENETLNLYGSGASKFVIQDITTKDFFGNISGASQLQIDKLAAQKFVLDSSGASHMQATISCSEFQLDMSGASSSTLKGNANLAKMELSGASSVSAPQFLIQKLDVDFSGASSGEVNVEESISGDLSGASSLKILGNASKKIHTSGGSSYH